MAEPETEEEEKPVKEGSESKAPAESSGNSKPDHGEDATEEKEEAKEKRKQGEAKEWKGQLVERKEGERRSSRETKTLPLEGFSAPKGGSGAKGISFVQMRKKSEKQATQREKETGPSESEEEPAEEDMIEEKNKKEDKEGRKDQEGEEEEVGEEGEEEEEVAATKPKKEEKKEAKASTSNAENEKKKPPARKQAHSGAMPCEIARNEQNGTEVDLISSLPDCVLSRIISCLPTKEGARTTVLSSRWCRLWAFAPLNFALHDLSAGGTQPACPPNSCASKDVISEVLKRHRGSVRRFCLDHLCLEGTDLCLKEWMHDLSKRCVQEIALKFTSRYHHLPSSLLMCKSLQSLELSCCWFPTTSENNPCFSGLIELTLAQTFISGKDLKCLLSSCQALRSLSLMDFHSKVREMEICSGSLQSLIVARSSFTKICIQDAPNLKRLMLSHGTAPCACVEVVHAPKLEVFGFLSLAFYTIVMGGTLLKPSDFSITTLIYSLKTLGLLVHSDAISHVTTAVRFLRFFPLLETLHIHFLLFSGKKKSSDLQYLNFEEPINCLDYHLKSVTLESYEGSNSIQRDFAKFIFARAKVLKVLKVVPMDDEWSEKMESDLLCMRNEVSSNAQVKVILTRNRSFGGGFYSADATNLSVRDPFDPF